MSVMCDVLLLLFFPRDREGNDSCYKPGNGHVLGDVTLDRHGDYGQLDLTADLSNNLVLCQPKSKKKLHIKRGFVINPHKGLGFIVFPITPVCCE